MTALQLTADEYIALRIDAVNLKHRLCDIEADCRNRLHRLAPPNRRDLNSTHIHGAHAPVEEPSTASTADKPEPTRMTPSGSPTRSHVVHIGFGRTDCWSARLQAEHVQHGRMAHFLELR